jgi:ligand-binding sensor domain-containing protein
MKGIVCVLISFTLMLPAAYSQAQDKLEFVYQNYTAADGLLCSQVLSMLKDKKDNIWIGSVAGLSRLNSLGIRNYSTDDGLCSNQITALCEDNTGRIWIGSTNGISIYDNNAFSSINNKRFESSIILTMYCDRANDVWVAVKSEKVNIYKLNSKFEVKDSIINSPWVKSITEIDGELTINTTRGIKLRKKAKMPLLNTLVKHTDSDYIYATTQEGDRYFVCTRSGLEIWDKSGAPPLKFLGGYEVMQVGLLKNTIYCTTNKGLVTLKMNSSGDYRIFYPASPDLSHMLFEIFIDNEQNLWLSSFDKGLLRCRESVAQKLDFSPDLFGMNLYAFSCDKKNPEVIIAGSTKEPGNALFYKIDYTRNNKAVRIFPNISITEGMVTATLRTTKDEYWIGGNLHGILVTDKRGKIIRRYNDYSFTRAQYIFLFEASDSTVWAGSILNGVFIFDQKGNYKQHITSDSFKLNLIGSIYEDHRKNIWISGDGLLCYRNGKFVDYTEALGLHGSLVTQVAERNGMMVISTVGKGVLLFSMDHNGNVKLQTEITARKGLRSNNITDVAIDAKGNIWAMYITGVSCVEMDGGEIRSVKYFDADDGLLQNDWDYSRIAIAGDTMFIVTSKGVVVASPSELLRNVKQFNYKPVITNVSLLNGREPVSPFDLRLINDNETNIFDIPYNQNAIAVEYASNSYYHRKDTYYQYMLEGFDKDWQAPTQVNTVNYISLSPGTYKFKVRVFKGQKPEDNEGNISSFSFVISPPFWQREWFYIVTILSVIGIVMGYIRLRIHKIRKSETEKTNINKKIADLELRALQAQLNPHFIFNALNSIQLFVVENNNEHAYRYLGKFSKLLRRVLDSSVNSIITIEEEIELVKLYIEIEALRFDHQFCYEIKYDEGYNYDTVFIPSMLLQPYVENAIKHGLMPKEGVRRLLVEITIEGKNVKIIIEDNGIGRQQAALNNGHNLIYESRGVSLGEDRLKVLRYFENADCDVRIEDLYDNTIATGTRIIITVPQDLKLN